MPSTSADINWATLRQLRQKFLEGSAGNADYWESLNDLEQYDATFAQRIGWKWKFVLNDLTALGWRPPIGNIVDWGCGSGIASRVLIDHFGSNKQDQLWLSDRSSDAVQFAERRASQRFEELTIQRGVPEKIDLLIISHVLTELDQTQTQELVQLAQRAESVVWVEPGTYEASLTLIAIRERVRESSNVVAPCTHQNRCGILAPENERHWCHFFATPPSEIFTDSFWSQFGLEMEIDLRSLPLSFLVLDKRPWPKQLAPAARILGRPTVFKPHAEILACSCEGVCPVKVFKRTHANVYRQLKKGKVAARVTVRSESGRVVEWAE